MGDTRPLTENGKLPLHLPDHLELPCNDDQRERQVSEAANLRARPRSTAPNGSRQNFATWASIPMRFDAKHRLNTKQKCRHPIHLANLEVITFGLTISPARSMIRRDLNWREGSIRSARWMSDDLLVTPALPGSRRSLR